MDTIEEKALRIYPDDTNPTLEPNATYRRACERSAYIKACEEYESLPKIHGWVARDKEPDELIFVPGDEKPIRMATYWFCESTWSYVVIKDIFPKITWESEPVEVELLIRKV